MRKCFAAADLGEESDGRAEAGIEGALGVDGGGAGAERVAVGGVVDEAGDALGAVLALELGPGGYGVAAAVTAEEAEVRVQADGLLLVRRPGDAEAGRDVGEFGGVALQEGAEAERDGEAGRELPVVLDEEDELGLGEVDLRVSGGAAELGGRAAGEREQGAAVLLEAGDVGGLAGGLVAAIEHRGGAAAEGVGAVEVGGEGALLAVGEELEAGLEVVVFGGEDEVVVPLGAELADALLAEGCAAAGEAAGDDDLRGGADGDVGFAAPV